MGMRPSTEEKFCIILDAFSGADGGGAFMKVRWLIEEMDKRASGGDRDAWELVAIMVQFANLVEYADKKFLKRQ